jgi:hypothetical protein
MPIQLEAVELVNARAWSANDTADLDGVIYNLVTENAAVHSRDCTLIITGSKSLPSLGSDVVRGIRCGIFFGLWRRQISLRFGPTRCC